MMADAAVQLLAEQGSVGLTVRGVAARAGVAPPTLLAWFDSRDRMVLVAGLTICERWIQLLYARSTDLGVHALLPGNDGEIVWTRVWLAVVELAHRNQHLAEGVAETFDAEAHYLRRYLKHDIAEGDLAALTALVSGPRQRSAPGCLPPPSTALDDRGQGRALPLDGRHRDLIHGVNERSFTQSIALVPP